MFRNDHIAFATAVVALAIAVSALAVGPVASLGQNQGASGAPLAQAQDDAVTVDNFSVDDFTLRNVTATNVVVRELTVRQAGSERNVTVRNATFRRFTVNKSTLSGVRFQNATVRSEKLVTDFGFHYARGTNVTNESRGNLLVENRTLDGVIIENLTVESTNRLDFPVRTRDVSLNRSEADLVVETVRVREVQSVRAFSGNQTDAS